MHVKNQSAALLAVLLPTFVYGIFRLAGALGGAEAVPVILTVAVPHLAYALVLAFLFKE
jgi:lipopolysaccharide export LptBFGC system permease protein LptF